MKTKIVYVLTSSYKDYYLEQTLISIYSLRVYHPDAEVLVVTDTETATTFVGKRALISEYAQIVPIKTPTHYNNLRKSRYLKTKLRNIVKGDYLYIDTDTVIAKSLDGIDNLETDIVAIADKHVIMCNHPKRDIIKQQLLKVGIELDDSRAYINSGVMFSKDSPLSHEFYDLWHKKWEEVENVQPLDQPPLAWADEELGHPVTLIDGTWNCQVLDNGLIFMTNAKIIHYFASSKDSNGNSPYLLYSDDVYNEIAETGMITERIDKIIRNPYSAFSPICKIVAGDDLRYLESNLHSIFQSYRSFFILVEKFSSHILDIIRKIHLSRLIQ